MFQLQNLHSQKRTMNVILSKMFGHSKINCNYCIKVKTLMDVEHWQRLMTSTTVRLCNINFFLLIWCVEYTQLDSDHGLGLTKTGNSG